LKIALTFDVEKDCPPFFTSAYGVEEGLPKILEMLDERGIKSTFFVTGEVAEEYPELVNRISKKHEIGCHGYYHESFDEIGYEKEKAVKKSKELLESVIHGEVLGFRAPRLEVCSKLYCILEELGFKYDSSIASFMPLQQKIKTNIPEFKLEVSNVTLRFPGGIIVTNIVCRKSSFPVLFYHPWEAIDMRRLLSQVSKKSYFRLDHWFNTGEPFLRKLKRLLKDLNHMDFTLLRDMIKQRD
jgi:peptidoglycan/xylan/chitin deacetylase (PgdA/CDA1 family)